MLFDPTPWQSVGGCRAANSSGVRLWTPLVCSADKHSAGLAARRTWNRRLDLPLQTLRRHPIRVERKVGRRPPGPVGHRDPRELAGGHFHTCHFRGVAETHAG